MLVITVRRCPRGVGQLVAFPLWKLQLLFPFRALLDSPLINTIWKWWPPFSFHRECVSTSNCSTHFVRSQETGYPLWLKANTLSMSYFCPFKILLDFWHIGIPAWFCSGRLMHFSPYSYWSYSYEHLWSSYHGDVSVFSKTWCFTSIYFMALTQCGSPQWVAGLLLCTWSVINRSSAGWTVTSVLQGASYAPYPVFLLPQLNEAD